MGRRIGVGLNQPRVLGLKARDYRKAWDLMRRLTRLVRHQNRKTWWQEPIGCNVPETFRKCRKGRNS